MLKYLFIPLVAILTVGCNSMSGHKSLADSIHAIDTALKTIPVAKLIVPGKRIGSIYITENIDSLVNQAGKWDNAHKAIGGTLLIYHNKDKNFSYQSSVYVNTNKSGEIISSVKEIRETSPKFKTADYAGAGSALKDVIKIYKLKPG